MEQGFKYDVAFSFLARDEPTAQKINELIGRRLSTFLYSARQKELVGKDGEEEFSRVFAREARVVVVLYRTGWGKTNWTRVEETAIKNRGFDAGYDFVLVIPRDRQPSAPPWFPKPRIWFDFGRWGAEGAAPVIEQRVKDAGGSPYPPTPEGMIAERAHIRATEAERQRALLEHGLQWAEEEAKALLDRFGRLEDRSAGFHVGRDAYAVRLHIDATCTLRVEWRPGPYRHSENEPVLNVVFWRGPVPLDLNQVRGEMQRIRDRSFEFDLSSDLERVWRETRSGRTYTSEQLVVECVELLTNRSRRGAGGATRPVFRE